MIDGIEVLAQEPIMSAPLWAVCLVAVVVFLAVTLPLFYSSNSELQENCSMAIGVIAALVAALLIWELTA